MEAKAAYWPIGIRMSAWSLKCGALSEVARRMAEYASLLRPTCCANTAELRALSAHVQLTILEDALSYTSFVSLSRTFFRQYFFHCFPGDLFCWLCCPNFSKETFDRDFFAPFRLLTRL